MRLFAFFAMLISALVASPLCADGPATAPAELDRELDRVLGTLVILPDSALGRSEDVARDTTHAAPSAEPKDAFVPVTFLAGGTWRGVDTEIGIPVEITRDERYAWRNDSVALHFDQATTTLTQPRMPPATGFFAYDPVARTIIQWTHDARRPGTRLVLEHGAGDGFDLKGDSTWILVRKTGPNSFTRETKIRTAGAWKTVIQGTYTRSPQ